VPLFCCRDWTDPVAAFAANVRIFSNSLFGFSDYGAKLQLPKAATDKKPPEVFPSSILRGVERYVLDVKRGNVVGVNLSDFRRTASKWDNILGRAARDVESWNKWLVRVHYAGQLILLELHAPAEALNSWRRFCLDGADLSVPPHWDGERVFAAAGLAQCNAFTPTPNTAAVETFVSKVKGEVEKATTDPQGFQAPSRKLTAPSQQRERERVRRNDCDVSCSL
jgi:hypothetical protein